MAYKFPSDEWIAEFKKEINANEEYKKAATTWEGVVVLIFNADPAIGLTEDFIAWVDLWHGECREIKKVTLEEAQKAPYVIRGTYANWKQVVQGRLGPVKGMMQGKLKLKGDLPTIVKYVKASDELVKCAAKVPSEFLDE
jgi:putative sterol carrier protein